MSPPPELVVLVDESGAPVGTAPKATVHTAETPLHLAFSCHLVDRAGRVLITRRSLNKLTWPGVWTNSFCGHPGPEEPIEEAVRRRARQELGATLGVLRLVLPDFRYRAVDASGIVEHEICPVFVAEFDGELDPAPSEVAEWDLVAPADLATAVDAVPRAFSPWLGLQIQDVAAHLAASQPSTPREHAP